MVAMTVLREIFQNTGGVMYRRAHKVERYWLVNFAFILKNFSDNLL